MINIDFHVHSKYSFDSLMKIEKIIKIAKHNNITGVAICDHNVFSYPKIKKNIKTKDNDFFIIPGMEIATNMGDIIAIMITETIKSNSFLDCLDEIKSQGGISLLPHPYRRKRIIDVESLAQKIDWLEKYNSRSTSKQNDKSKELCKIMKKPFTVGSDAHLYHEIGASYVEIKNVNAIDEIIKEISKRNCRIVTKASSRKVHYWSSFIGAIKTKRFGPFIKGVFRELKGGL